MDSQLLTYLQSVQAQGYPWESVKNLLVQSEYTSEQIQAAEKLYQAGPIVITSDNSVQPDPVVATAPRSKTKLVGIIVAILLLVLAAGGGVAFYLKNQPETQVALVDDSAPTTEEPAATQMESKNYAVPLPQVDVVSLAANPNSLLDAINQSLESVTAYSYTHQVKSDNEYDLPEYAADELLSTTFTIQLNVSLDQVAAEPITATEGEIAYFKRGEGPTPEKTQKFSSYKQGNRYLVKMQPIPGVTDVQMLFPANQWIDTSEAPPEMVMMDPSLMFKNFHPFVTDPTKMTATDLSAVSSSETRMIDGVECVKAVFTFDATERESGDSAPEVEKRFTVWIGKQDALPREIVEVATTDYDGIRDITTKTTTFTGYNQDPEIVEPTDVKQMSELQRGS